MSILATNLSTPIAAEPISFYGVGSRPTIPSNDAKWIEVLVDTAIPFNNDAESSTSDKLFTYSLPPDLNVLPGDILSVPFGKQQLGAIAIRYIKELPANLTIDQIRDIDEVICPGFFPPSYWQLLEKISLYYQTPLIQVIKTALPPGLLGKSQRRIRLISAEISADEELLFLSPKARQVLSLLKASSKGDYTWNYIQQQIPGARRPIHDLIKRGLVESYLEPPTPPQPKMKPAITLVADFIPELTSRQREVLEILRRQGGEMWLDELLKMCQTSTSVTKALEQKGCVVISPQEVLRQNRGIEQIADQPKVLNENQSLALETILKISGYGQVLLHGVTGSGKTEVYLQAIEPLLKQGKSALVLVPEIGLTPQLADRFRARFGDKICIYNSTLSTGERYDTWRQSIQGIAQVMIGTRSAIFAPLPNLGIIILDEEHDTSFKQDQPAPCYHTRNVAQWRAELDNCPLILGSATPSLESWFNINLNPNKSPLNNQQKYYISLPERIYSRPLPPIEIIDMRQELKENNRSIFSQKLQQCLKQLLEYRQQGILFIPRRGYSTFVSCRSCGYVMECPNCDVSLSYHYTHEGAAQLLRCHYCNHSELQPDRCPECDSPYFKFFGSGTQKVEQELSQLFPELRIIRYDSDTTRTKDAHRQLLTKFAKGEADLLVGTQMLTKGLDLEQVTLVGVVAADGLLHLSDYRASERAFQILTQVAGRAGRGIDPGRVIIQTYNPEHQVIQAVQRHAYAGFVTAELQGRLELNYPPYGCLILLKISSFDETEVAVTAEKIASFLLNQTNANHYEVLGPSPAPIERIANRYRWHILLKFSPEYLDKLPDLNKLRELCPHGVNLIIDVDPVNLG